MAIAAIWMSALWFGCVWIGTGWRESSFYVLTPLSSETPSESTVPTLSDGRVSSSTRHELWQVAGTITMQPHRTITRLTDNDLLSGSVRGDTAWTVRHEIPQPPVGRTIELSPDLGELVAEFRQNHRVLVVIDHGWPWRLSRGYRELGASEQPSSSLVDRHLWRLYQDVDSVDGLVGTTPLFLNLLYSGILWGGLAHAMCGCWRIAIGTRRFWEYHCVHCGYPVLSDHRVCPECGSGPNAIWARLAWSVANPYRRSKARLTGSTPAERSIPLDPSWHDPPSFG